MNTKFEIAGDVKIAREALDLSQEKIASVLKVSARAIRWMKALEEFELNDGSKERLYFYVLSKFEGFNKLKREIRKATAKPDEPLLFHGSKQGIEGAIDPKKNSMPMILARGSNARESYEQSAIHICDELKDSVYLFCLKKAGLTFKSYGANLDWFLAVRASPRMLKGYRSHPSLQKIVEGANPATSSSPRSPAIACSYSSTSSCRVR